MSFPVEVHGLGVDYGTTPALRDVSFSLSGGTIVGLLGRNGAGKTTLLSTLAAFRRPTAGSVRVDGADPWEDHRLMSEICLVREDGDLEDGTRVGQALELAGLFRPRWDQDHAERLLDAFEIPLRRRVGALSRGQRSAVAVSIGLATGAPLTMFDEPHLGMDAPSRYRFYDELLADYLVSRRTFIVSTHLIDEVAALLEDVVILDRGRILTHRSATDLQARGVVVTGPADRVDELVGGLSVLSERTLGRTKSVVLFGELNGELRQHAAAAGLELGPIPLQDLFVSLTDREHAP